MAFFLSKSIEDNKKHNNDVFLSIQKHISHFLLFKKIIQKIYSKKLFKKIFIYFLQNFDKIFNFKK